MIIRAQKNLLSVFAASLIMLLLAGCASAPESAAAAAPAEEPAAFLDPPDEKYETVIRRIPVLARETRYLSSGNPGMYTEFEYKPGTTVLISSVTYDMAGSVYEKMEAEHRDSTIIMLYHDRQNALMQMKRETYDSKGNLTESVLFDNSASQVSRSVYSFDDAGSRIKWEIYDSSDTLLAYNSYLYEEGLNVRTESFSPSGVLEEYYVSSFSSEGRKTETRSYNSAGRLLGRTVYTYEGDRPASEMRYRGENILLGGKRYSFEETEKSLTEKIDILNRDGSVLETVEKKYIFIIEEEKRRVAE